MVCINKLFSHSLLSSFLIVSSLSAMKTPQNLVPFSNLNMTEATLEFSSKAVHTHGLGKDFGLFYDKYGFFIRTNENNIRIKTYDTDNFLRSRNVKDMAKYAMLGKFKVSKFDNGEYAVSSHGELKGGGVGGTLAGFYIGKFVVHFVGHGAIYLAGACTGPLAPVTIAALEGTFLPLIELTSNAVAIGTGIIGGAMTGPV